MPNAPRLLRVVLPALLLVPLGGASGSVVAVHDAPLDERVYLRAGAGAFVTDQEMAGCRALAADLRSYSVASDGDALTLRLVRARADAPLECAGTTLAPPAWQGGGAMLHRETAGAFSPAWIAFSDAAGAAHVCLQVLPPWDARPVCRTVPSADVRDGDAWVLQVPLHGTYLTDEGDAVAYDLRGSTYALSPSLSARYDHALPAGDDLTFRASDVGPSARVAL